MASKYERPLSLQMAGQPGDTRENLERRHVHIRKCPPPSRDQMVDFVFH